ncbi:hypothetical protein LAZ40_24630 [Cereibacter sphaeroides]|uniref:hypothetical protein n=1 Tax=Cereibacter sphaeroides TaxID=1063 RepID=UPI001F42381A|nr:hypothetical protein [Cereibacter sphaeroides]MCE6952680.1 hypothetical protein [Cereibacter sphaeroides]MCE6962223.1 hypothetical protein [Cereibacter sphaeroides]MCE6970999.1 hypothetical protein [Cereibacter sphaeroides]MCE6972407.1 hypothetical protein [Cereibacter sphaeroides]
MTHAKKTKDEAPKPEVATDSEQGLGHLLAEMQALALVLPPTDRTDAEIEADFDNMPV